jgi:hypothetical protein
MTVFYVEICAFVPSSFVNSDTLILKNPPYSEAKGFQSETVYNTSTSRTTWSPAISEFRRSQSGFWYSWQSFIITTAPAPLQASYGVEQKLKSSSTLSGGLKYLWLFVVHEWFHVEEQAHHRALLLPHLQAGLRLHLLKDFLLRPQCLFCMRILKWLTFRPWLQHRVYEYCLWIRTAENYLSPLLGASSPLQGEASSLWRAWRAQGYL